MLPAGACGGSPTQVTASRAVVVGGTAGSYAELSCTSTDPKVRQWTFPTLGPALLQTSADAGVSATVDGVLATATIGEAAA